MLNFCTLFNSVYLTRGLALYESLERQCPSFHLYVLAFDNECYSFLNKLNLKHATIISLAEFEDEALLAVKPQRSTAEYCWTCTSSSIAYCIKKYSLDHCTYVDADIFFFSDPGILLKEMGDKSVLITEHRYSPQYDQTALSGKYCVQFITFKNNEEGLLALNWWKNACLEWCYNKWEDNKFGDQKYLDDWTTRFSGVHELRHLGGGVAPWNVDQYTFQQNSLNICGTSVSSGEQFDLVFYHFHDLKYINKNIFSLSGHYYRLSGNAVAKIYKPYIEALNAAETKVKEQNVSIQPHELTGDFKWLKKAVGRYILFLLRGYYRNYYHRRLLKHGLFN
ncbi:glycosyl transferase [Arcticibacter tournemirensis]|uniref:Glycosyl transferase n=1 Tax=Arcticibacter tournemirensis TaxID=699437 RepID=A0A4Q0M866_9SPHI|nr:glycosyl transferase [Arcticibacter tournemirensis]RXF69083.1 glycosyl transferase [Arcticibacter tournemirensis]